MSRKSVSVYIKFAVTAWGRGGGGQLDALELAARVLMAWRQQLAVPAPAWGRPSTWTSAQSCSLSPAVFSATVGPRVPRPALDPADVASPARGTRGWISRGGSEVGVGCRQWQRLASQQLGGCTVEDFPGSRDQRGAWVTPGPLPDPVSFLHSLRGSFREDAALHCIHFGRGLAC